MNQKLLCVQRDKRGKLKVGEIYTLEVARACYKRLWIAVSEITFSGNHRYSVGDMVRCPCCGKPETIIPFFNFFSRRFVPWNPEQLNVTEEEANELYIKRLRFDDLPARPERVSS